MRHLWKSLLALGLVWGLVSAQDKQSPKPTEDKEGKVFQGTFEIKFPTEQHKKLDALRGEWDVAVRFKAGPGPNDFKDGKATCKSDWMLDGMAMHQQYKSEMNGKPFAVVQVYGYDKEKKKFFELKMDNMDTGVMHNEGDLAADGKSINFTGERIDPMTKKQTKIRTVLTFVDKDSFHIEWYIPNADGKEEKVVMLNHTRKK